MSDPTGVPKEKPVELLTLEMENSSGDNMQVTARGSEVQITVEEPWAGDTETGFGYTTHVSLNLNQVCDLIDFLSDWVQRTKP